MATEILRPNAAGDETNLVPIPGTGEANWEDVDEAVADEDTTYVRYGLAAWMKDLYNLPAHSGSGTINSVTVYARCKANGSPIVQTSAIIRCKTNGTVYEGNEITVTTSYVNYSKAWATTPNTGSAWTWTEIDALQIGVGLRRWGSSGGTHTHCTQFWVEVDYTSVITENSSSDNGAGLEGAPVPTATLAGSESGQGQGAISLQLATITAVETGTSVELGALLQDLFASELGQGSDSLIAKIEAPTKGGGMKLWI